MALSMAGSTTRSRGRPATNPPITAIAKGCCTVQVTVLQTCSQGNAALEVFAPLLYLPGYDFHIAEERQRPVLYGGVYVVLKGHGPFLSAGIIFAVWHGPTGRSDQSAYCRVRSFSRKIPYVACLLHDNE